MYRQIEILSQRAQIAREKLKHINNRREKKVVKMLEHFSDRLHKLERLCKETNTNLVMCSYIVSDLEEMIWQIEKQVNHDAVST